MPSGPEPPFEKRRGMRITFEVSPGFVSCNAVYPPRREARGSSCQARSLQRPDASRRQGSSTQPRFLSMYAHEPIAAGLGAIYVNQGRTAPQICGFKTTCARTALSAASSLSTRVSGSPAEVL